MDPVLFHFCDMERKCILDKRVVDERLTGSSDGLFGWFETHAGHFDHISILSDWFDADVCNDRLKGSIENRQKPHQKAR